MFSRTQRATIGTTACSGAKEEILGTQRATIDWAGHLGFDQYLLGELSWIANVWKLPTKIYAAFRNLDDDRDSRTGQLRTIQ